MYLNFYIEFYKLQQREGRYLLHERPLPATPWKEPGMMMMETFEEIIRTKTYTCGCYMIQMTRQGPKFVNKPMGFFTNSPSMTNHMHKYCLGERQYIHLEDSRTKQIHIFFDYVCRQFIRTFENRKKYIQQEHSILEASPPSAKRSSEHL